MNALRQLYWANLTEFLSNKRALGLTIAFPVLFIVIFGLVFTNQDKQTARIGLVVEDTGPVGDQLATKLEELPSVGSPAASAGRAGLRHGGSSDCERRDWVRDDSVGVLGIWS